jgi:hypothetical protein
MIFFRCEQSREGSGRSWPLRVPVPSCHLTPLIPPGQQWPASVRVHTAGARSGWFGPSDTSSRKSACAPARRRKGRRKTGGRETGIFSRQESSKFLGPLHAPTSSVWTVTFESMRLAGGAKREEEAETVREGYSKHACTIASYAHFMYSSAESILALTIMSVRSSITCHATVCMEARSLVIQHQACMHGRRQRPCIPSHPCTSLWPSSDWIRHASERSARSSRRRRRCGR